MTDNSFISWISSIDIKAVLLFGIALSIFACVYTWKASRIEDTAPVKKYILGIFFYFLIVGIIDFFELAFGEWNGPKWVSILRASFIMIPIFCAYKWLRFEKRTPDE